MNHGHVLNSARYALGARRFYVTVFIENVFTKWFLIGECDASAK